MCGPPPAPTHHAAPCTPPAPGAHPGCQVHAQGAAPYLRLGLEVNLDEGAGGDAAAHAVQAAQSEFYREWRLVRGASWGGGHGAGGGRGGAPGLNGAERCLPCFMPGVLVHIAFVPAP